MSIDDLIQYLLVGMGIVILGLGIVVAVSPGLATVFPFGTGTIATFGVVIVAAGLLLARSRLNVGVHDADTPNPESPAPSSIPGDDVDRMLFELTQLRRGTIEYRERLTERLREAAVSVVAYREDCTEAEAARMIDDESWTDDPEAASFFTHGGGAGPSFVEQLFSRGNSSSEFERHVERTVDAIGRLTETEQDAVAPESADETETGGGIRSLLGGSDEDGDARAEWNPEWVNEYADNERESWFDLDVHETNHWQGVSLFALLAIGTGVVSFQPALVLAGTVGLAYAGFSRAATTPSVESLQVERVVSDDSPEPGEEIDIQVTIENTGKSTLPDLRIVDVVPDAWTVVDGGARAATTLRAGDSITLRYTAAVHRGEYSWPVYLAARDHSESIERESFYIPEGTVSCIPSLKTTTEMPVRAQTSQYAGGVATRTGGSGIEFHSVREYRDGDPMNRVNWKRLAKTGELSTIDFRQEQAAMVTLLFDSREKAYVAPSRDGTHAVDRAVDAAGDVFGSLYDNGDLVGVAAFDTVPCWLSPGSGTEQLERARLIFANHTAMSPIPPSRVEREGGYVDPLSHVRRQLPSSSQVVLFTPLCDDYAAEVARQLDSAGHLVTVVSTDPTAAETVGQRLAGIERTVRLNRLRERGIRVLDWKPEDTLAIELRRAQMRWAL